MSFSDYIHKQPIASSELPMVHTTGYSRLASIQATNTLQASPCKVFNESLLYFFYGRPAYRDANQTTPTRDIGFYPICFVFGPGTIGAKAKRVYPFDTGASRAGLYEPAISRHIALGSYPVHASIESVRKIVGCFFETEEQYLSNKPRTGLSFAPAEAEAESYYALINGGGDPKCDDRCSAVEIQIAECLDIRQGLLAIVLPTCFLEDDVLTETITKVWRANPLTYDADIGMRPIEFHGVVRHKIREFYRRVGLL